MENQNCCTVSGQGTICIIASGHDCGNDPSHASRHQLPVQEFKLPRAVEDDGRGGPTLDQLRTAVQSPAQQEIDVVRNQTTPPPLLPRAGVQAASSELHKLEFEAEARYAHVCPALHAALDVCLHMCTMQAHFDRAVVASCLMRHKDSTYCLFMAYRTSAHVPLT